MIVWLIEPVGWGHGSPATRKASGIRSGPSVVGIVGADHMERPPLEDWKWTGLTPIFEATASETKCSGERLVGGCGRSRRGICQDGPAPSNGLTRRQHFYAAMIGIHLQQRSRRTLSALGGVGKSTMACRARPCGPDGNGPVDPRPRQRSDGLVLRQDHPDPADRADASLRQVLRSERLSETLISTQPLAYVDAAAASETSRR